MSMVYESTTQSFNQSNLNTYYMCNSEQMVTLGSTRTTLYADQVRLQAFGLNKGQFTGDGKTPIVIVFTVISSSLPPSTSHHCKPNFFRFFFLENLNVACVLL